MPRNCSKAVPEGNGPIPHQDEFGSREPIMADFYRTIKELFDASDWKLDKLTEKMRDTKQRLAGLEQAAQQPRLTTEADVKTGTKIRKRMEDVAAERVISGDNSFAQVDADSTCLTSFGNDSTVPPALPCPRDDILVDNGAAVPKPCFLPTKMRTRTASSGLLPTDTASTAMRTIFPRPFFSWSLGETKKRTSRINNQLAPFWSFWWRVIETKSRQTLVFDPGGSTGRLSACPFLRAWRALLCGKGFVWAPDGTRGWRVFWHIDDSEYHFPREAQANRLRRTYCGQSQSLRSRAGSRKRSRKPKTSDGSRL